jgi:hypothetical protein
MRQVAPSRALMRRSRTMLEIGFVFVAAGIFLSIVALALYVIPASTSAETAGVFEIGRVLALIVGVISGLIGVALAVRAVTTRVENDLAQIVGNFLQQHLSDDFTFIRNINKRGLGYIDGLLVGLPGLLVFRILDEEGDFLNEGGRWLKRDKNGEWKPMLNNPTRDAVDDIKAVRRYLAERGLRDVPTFGVVVFLPEDPDVKLTLKEPVVVATHLPSLYRRLQKNYLAKERIDSATADAVVSHLYVK